MAAHLPPAVRRPYRRPAVDAKLRRLLEALTPPAEHGAHYKPRAVRCSRLLGSIYSSLSARASGPLNQTA